MMHQEINLRPMPGGWCFAGFVPDTLGEIYEYSPTVTEIFVTLSIWAQGEFLLLIETVRVIWCYFRGRHNPIRVWIERQRQGEKGIGHNDIASFHSL